MRSLKKYLSEISSENLIFWAIALTFLVLPTGTAPPLIGMGLACAIWIFSGPVSCLSMFKATWFRPVILFVVLPWIGLTYSQNLDLGMDYATKTQYWIAALITAGCCMDERRLFILVCALWTGLSTGAFLALIQFVGLTPPIKEGFYGFGIVYTLVAMYLIIGILMAAFYFKRAKDPMAKGGFLILILVFLCHLALLEGRSGYLIFALLSPLVARDLMHAFSTKIKVLVSVVLVLSLCLSPIVRHRVVDTFKNMSENREKMLKGDQIELIPRAFILSQTLQVMKKNFLVGIGTGSLTEPTKVNGYAVAHPHNNFLYMGVSFGIIGIFSCAWLFWNLFVRSWRARKTPLGYFVFSTGLVLFLGGMFDTQILNTGTLLMLTITYGFLHHLDGERKENR
jgi:O-antigen ligase